MLRATLALALVLAALSQSACEDTDPPAPLERPSGPLPVGTDDDPDTGVPARAPSLTSGGGAAASPAHRVQLSVGAPVPRGDASSADSRLHMDP